MTPEQIFTTLEMTENRALPDEMSRDIDTGGAGAEDVALHEILFANEQYARAILGTNLERIAASMESCSRIVKRLRPRRFADFGGGCGIACFVAAHQLTSCLFVIVDRAKSPLWVGQLWSAKLGLSNVEFLNADFEKRETAEMLLPSFDIVSIDYVFCPVAEEDTFEETATRMMPHLRPKAALAEHGIVQVRFGEFTPDGLRALIAAAFRNGLMFDEIDNSSKGITVIFKVNDGSVQDEGDAYGDAENDMFSQFWSS